MAHEYAIERTSLDLDVTRSDMCMYMYAMPKPLFNNLLLTWPVN